MEKSLPFSIDGTAGRESPLEMLDVLYDQAGLMNVDAKAAKESRTVADAGKPLKKANRRPIGQPGIEEPMEVIGATFSDVGFRHDDYQFIRREPGRVIPEYS